LLIAGGNDQRMPVVDMEKVQHASLGPCELWVVEKACHSQACGLAPEEYERKLITFFNQHLLGSEG